MMVSGRRRIVVAAVLAVGCLAGAAGPAFATEVGDEIVVITRSARLRSGNNVLGPVPFLTFLKVRKVNGEWYWVEWQGQQGWLNDEQACAPYLATIRLIGIDSEFDSYLGLAVVNQRLRSYGEALESWNWLCDADPGAAIWLVSRGSCYFEAGQLDAAESDLAAAIELDPQSYLPYLMRARCWLGRGDHVRAMADLNMAAELEPGQSAPYAERTALRLQRGDFAGALADAERARELDPHGANIRVARGDALQALGRLDEAYAEYTAALDLADATPAVYESRGNVELARGRVDAAISDYTSGIDQWLAKSKYVEAAAVRVRRSAAWQKQGDLQRARQDADEGAMYFETGAAYLQLAAVDMALGDHGRAAWEYERALELDSLNAVVLNDCAWFLATCPDAERRNGTRAVELAELACSLSAYSVGDYLDTLAAAWAEAGDFSRAVEWQKHAIPLMAEADRHGGLARLAQYERGEPHRLGESAPDPASDDEPAPAAPLFDEVAPAAPFAIP